MNEQQKREIARKLRQLADDVEKSSSTAARQWLDIGGLMEVAGEIVATSPERSRYVMIELEVMPCEK